MKPSFVKSQETSKLLDLFKTMRLDSPLTFFQASKAVGFTVTAALPAYQSAKRIAERDLSIVIEGIRGQGFLKINGNKMVESGDRRLLSIRRSARRGAQRQEIAITQNLDKEHMTRATELLGRYRIAADVASPARSNRKIVAEPEQEAVVDIRANLRTISSQK